jgi:cyanophycin synthetase
VTTAVGVLGTDDATRTTAELVATTRGLNQLGLTAFCHTGGYHVPPVTLTGTVRGEVALVDVIIGVGEIAVSDHRSSQPANLYEVGGVRVVVDFAHNPQGMAALADIAAALPARRRLVAVGQAGDRDDAAIRDLVRAAHALRPDHVIVKEMEKYRRGRAPGEVPGFLRDEFRRLGVPNAAISTAPDDLGALRRALEWAQRGDLLLVTIHADQQAALGLLERLRRARWEPGQPIPR